ncbi:hypothetical protein E4P36_26070 [Streptomyces sp. 4R-3d]|nr:hypothetical protein E4P36_26070 [Streptomyces sp. 4R-3d]
MRLARLAHRVDVLSQEKPSGRSRRANVRLHRVRADGTILPHVPPWGETGCPGLGLTVRARGPRGPGRVPVRGREGPVSPRWRGRSSYGRRRPPRRLSGPGRSRRRR